MPLYVSTEQLEIMASMLDFLSVPDLLVMARTGRRMREMVYDDTRWVKRLRSMGVWDEGEAREGARTNIESKVGEPTCSDAAITSIVNPGASVTEREQDALRSGFTTASIFNSLASDGDDNATDRATYALNVMSRASSVRGSARQEYGKIYATLNPYYTDILENCHASTITPVHSLSRNETAQTVVTQQRLRLFNLFETPEEQGQMLSQLYRFAQSDFALGCCERIAAVASVVTAFEGVALHKFEQGIEANDTDNTMARYARVLVTLNGGDSAVDTFILRNPRLQDLHTFGDPLECFKGSVTATVGISLQPLHDFFQLLCEVVMEQLNIVTRVFPSIKVGDAVRSFLSCVADKILADYATTLLDVANKRSREAFVKAVPALFEYCIRIAEAIVQKYGQALGQGLQYNISREIFEILVLQILNPHVKIYLRKELEYFSHNAKTEVSAWEKHLSEEQACTELFFMSNVNRQAAKRDFLSSFRKVVMMPISVVSGAPFALSDTSNASGRAPFKPSNSILEPRPSLLRSSTTGSFNRATSPHAQEPPTTELAAKAAIMNSRLEGINALFSIEVALNIVHCAKASIERMASFVKIGGELSGLARMQCEAVFVQLLQTLGTGHVKSGFDRAVAHLGEYKPRAVAKVISNSSEGKPKNAAVAAGISPAAVIVNDGDGDPTGVAPLVTFLELVNVGDLIQQMLDVFYSQELVATRLIDRDDFLNLATKEKKRFEQMLDERVAAGLNKGIDVLMAEVELICATIQQPADYNPSIVGITASRNAATATSRVSVGSLANTVITAQNKLNAYAEPVDVRPTDTARAVVALVSSHTNMLIGSTERTMLDVFNQEVGLRLFGQLCQHIKRQRISTSGAIKLIRYVTNILLS